jgi:Ca2+-binding EF-hand superfamily protein
MKYAVLALLGLIEVNAMTNQERVNGAFNRMDRNGDNVITPNEFPGSRAAFNKPDYNGDGQVTRAELLKYAVS